MHRRFALRRIIKQALGPTSFTFASTLLPLVVHGSRPRLHLSDCLYDVGDSASFAQPVAIGASFAGDVGAAIGARLSSFGVCHDVNLAGQSVGGGGGVPLVQPKALLGAYPFRVTVDRKAEQ